MPFNSSFNYSITKGSHTLDEGSIDTEESNITVQNPLTFTGYSVTFVVTDSENSPIPNAIINMNGYDEKTTDGNGKVVIDNLITEGYVIYTVESMGSITKTDSIIVDENKVIPIGLISDVATGLNQKHTKANLAYPNPANNYLMIDTPSGKDISIFTIDGYPMEKIMTYEDETYLLDISSYETGIYLIQIGETTQKISILH